MIPLILPLAMFEIIPIVFVAGLTLLVWIVSRAPTVPLDPAEEIERMEQYVAWLEDRWHRAKTQDYDDEMKARIAGELWQATEQLDAARAAIRVADKAA